MKRLVSIGLIVLAATFVAFAQEAPKKKKKSAARGDEQTLTKIEEDWGVALVKRDLAFIESVQAPDWVLVAPDGKLQTRAEANGELKAGTMVISSFKIDELKIRIYGDTAVVIGLDTEKSAYKGKDVSGQYRYTDIFVKKEGKWQCVSTHVTKVEKM